VLAVLVLSGLGVLVFLAVRTVPAGEESKDSPPSFTDRVGYAHRSERMGDDLGKDQPTSSSSSPNPAPAGSDVAHYRYKVVKTYPHDRRFFTQGLVYQDGFIYEGTGLYGQSAIYQRDLETGKTVKMLRLPDKYFGEGITLFGDKLIQLTWQSKVGFVYKKDTFTPLSEFKYHGEGWGLTHDGKRLILSDGTATLRFLDPNTYAETGRLEVRDQGRPVQNLNELEFIPDGPPVAQPAWRGRPALASRGHPGLAFLGQKARVASEVQGQDTLITKEQGRDALATAGAPPQAEGETGLIYANIWQSDRIAIIDPQTGRVTGWIDLTGLYTPPASQEGESVLNGIAYLPQTRHLLVTGKLWPRMYEIELTEKTP
jgi:glutamine cyclotransferase